MIRTYNLHMLTPEQFITHYRTICHFDQDNGLKFEVTSPGDVTYYMTVLDKHLSSPGWSHGGAIAGFMDCVLGMSALSLSIENNNLVSTVEFKMNFIRPAKLGEKLIGKGKIDYKGKSLIIASADIHTEKGELVAKGLGTFNSYPMEKKGALLGTFQV